MTKSFPKALVCAALVKLSLLGAALNTFASNDQLFIHDPVIAKEHATYYLFSTGPGISIYSSPDLVNWQPAGRAFATEPSWAQQASPGFNGHLWAPDIIQRDGTFYLYYSVSEFGKNNSAIGLTINKTLDPGSPDYQWHDQGIVVQSVANRDDWNAIDPHIARDKQGAAWMSFGSFWGGLKMFKLNEQWDAPAQPQQWFTIAKAKSDDMDVSSTEIEAPFIYHRGNYYYLFISRGLCCRGADSTYHLAVGRSASLTGPYRDKNGVNMNNGGGSILINGNSRWPGLGHNAVYNLNGKDVLVLHAYEAADAGRQKLKILDLHWDKEGWPLVDPKALDTFVSSLASSHPKTAPTAEAPYSPAAHH